MKINRVSPSTLEKLDISNASILIYCIKNYLYQQYYNSINALLQKKVVHPEVLLLQQRTRVLDHMPV